MDPEVRPSQRHRRNQSRGRSLLTAPLLAVGLAIIAVGLVGAILLVPGLLPAPAPSPSCRDGCLPASAAVASPTASPLVSVLPSFVRPTPTPLPTFISYVVKAGDSLNTIAHRYRTTARSIAWWNRGTYPTLDPESAGYQPGHIEPGWILVLIPGVTVDDANPPTPSPGPPTPGATTLPQATT
jgi:LysM domain-containing protein